MAMVASNQATLATPRTTNTAAGRASAAGPTAGPSPPLGPSSAAGWVRRRSARSASSSAPATATQSAPPARAWTVSEVEPGRTQAPTAASVSFRLVTGDNAEVPRPSPVAFPVAATLRTSHAPTGTRPTARKVVTSRIRPARRPGRASSTTAPTG